MQLIRWMQPDNLTSKTYQSTTNFLAAAVPSYDTTLALCDESKKYLLAVTMYLCYIEWHFHLTIFHFALPFHFGLLSPKHKFQRNAYRSAAYFTSNREWSGNKIQRTRTCQKYKNFRKTADRPLGAIWCFTNSSREATFFSQKNRRCIFDISEATVLRILYRYKYHPYKVQPLQ